MRDPGEETVRAGRWLGGALPAAAQPPRREQCGWQHLLQVPWCVFGGPVKAPSAHSLTWRPPYLLGSYLVPHVSVL